MQESLLILTSFCKKHALPGNSASGLNVARMIISISFFSTPHLQSAQIWRLPGRGQTSLRFLPPSAVVPMPVRCLIHSSEVSINDERSSFFQIFGGTYMPEARIFDLSIL